MTGNSIAGAWIAGLAIWAGALGMLSTLADTPSSAMADLEQPAVEQTVADPFDTDRTVDYWLEARDEPDYRWPNEGVPGL